MEPFMTGFFYINTIDPSESAPAGNQYKLVIPVRWLDRITSHATAEPASTKIWRNPQRIKKEGTRGPEASRCSPEGKEARYCCIPLYDLVVLIGLSTDMVLESENRYQHYSDCNIG
jgi:hypothetical protein